MKMQNQILLAESESIVASDISQLIHQWGLGDTIVTRSDKHTCQIARDISPKLAIVDECLQGSEKAETTATYLNENYHIPVVFLANVNIKKIQERMQNHKSFYCLAKPFIQDELKDVLEMLIKTSKN